MWRRAAGVMAVVILAVSAAGPATADEGAAGIKVAPVKIDAELRPGGKGQVEATVTNTGQVAVKLSLESQDFDRDVDGNYRFFTAKERPPAASASGWLSLTQPDVELKPGESYLVKASIRVPKTAEPGTHSAMIFVLGSPVADNTDQKGAVVVGRPRIGVMVRATVEGKIVDKLDFLGLEAARWNWGGPVDFNLLFANKGNVHKDVAGRVTIANKNGKVAEVPVSEWTSLPNSDLRIKSVWEKPAYGRFTATAAMASRGGDEWERSAAFYVIPLRQTALGAALALLLLGLGRFLSTKYSFKLERKEGDSD
jgi:hypothetical protein